MKLAFTFATAGMVFFTAVSNATAQAQPATSGTAREATPTRASAKESKQPKKADSEYPVIGHIETRGRTITIKAGPSGPVYTVKTAEGKVLVKDGTEKQLRAQAPELHDFIKTAVAAQKGKSGEKLDATLRRDMARPVPSKQGANQ